MRFRLIAGFLVIAALTPSQASRPVGAILDDDLAAKLPRMRVLMKEGLDRERRVKPDSRVTSRPKESIFRGSYDRHSNIAAHWALLSWARRTSDAAETKAILGRLGPEALEAERDWVEASRANPYADAWLLLLLREIGRTSDDARVLALARDLTEKTEARLLKYLSDCPAAGPGEPESAPESRTPRPPQRIGRWTSGAYDSPLWAMLVLQLSPPAGVDRRTQVEGLRVDRVPAVRALPDREGRPLADFLWVDSMLWMSDALADCAAPLSDYTLPDYVPPRPKITLGNCHSLGCEVVKLWPLAWKTSAGDAGARKAFNDRLRMCLEREDAWDGPFATVSHWVPQFVYFAVWLAEGRP